MDSNLTGDPIWRIDDYLHFKKCGIITASPDEKCFGLNCIFCKTICLKFENFMEHIRTQHSRELCALYFTTDDVDEEMTELIDGVENVGQRNENNNKHNIILNTQSVPMPIPPVTTQVDEIVMQQELQKIVLELAELDTMKNMELGQQEGNRKVGEKIEEIDNNNKKNELESEDIEANELAEFLNFELLPRNICSPEEETSSEHSSSHDSAITTTTTTATTISTTATTISTKESESKHSKEALNYILQAFKSNKALWDRNHTDYKYNCKKKYYDEIAEQLKADLGYIMTGTDIGRELKKLRNMYRIDLMKMQNHKGLYIPKLWCFEQMEFIRKPMEMARRSATAWKGRMPSVKASDAAEANASTNATSNLLSVDVMYKIIEAYESHPCLWHVEHPDFRSSTFRKTALNDMLNVINSSMQLSFTLQQLERILKNLRRNYSHEKHEQITAEKSQSDTGTHTPTFRYYNELKKFLEPHLGPFSCTQCDDILNTSDQFKIHTSTHDGSSPFICSICKKGFTSSGNLAVHLRRHRGDFPFECEECGKRLATSPELAIHKRTHTGERPFVCELCGKDYNSWSFFNIHKRMHLNQPSFVCPVCQKGFYEKRKYVEHMNAHLDIRDKECKVCGKTFTCHNNLKTHLELHAEAKKHKCIICGRTFAQAAGLRSHMISLHSEIRTPNLRTRSQLVKYY